MTFSRYQTYNRLCETKIDDFYTDSCGVGIVNGCVNSKITAPDDVRWESIKERDKTFVQTTAQDVKEKGDLLPQRINDTFLAYADEIEFYYRDEVKQDARLAARWIRSGDISQVQGTLQIVSSGEYEQIKAIHNAVAKTLERPDLAWESTVEKNSKILAK